MEIRARESHAYIASEKRRIERLLPLCGRCNSSLSLSRFLSVLATAEAAARTKQRKSDDQLWNFLFAPLHFSISPSPFLPLSHSRALSPLCSSHSRAPALCACSSRCALHLSPSSSQTRHFILVLSPRPVVPLLFLRVYTFDPIHTISFFFAAHFMSSLSRSLSLFLSRILSATRGNDLFCFPLFPLFCD